MWYIQAGELLRGMILVHCDLAMALQSKERIHIILPRFLVLLTGKVCVALVLLAKFCLSAVD